MPINIGRGQLTLTDINDAISSPTAPSNPTIGTLWIDESASPKLLKKWNGTMWVVLGEVSKEGTGETIVNITETLGNMANDNKLNFNERQVIKDKITEIIGYIIADNAVLPTTAVNDAGGSGKGTFYYVRRSATMAGLSATDKRYVAVATQYNNLKTYLESLNPIKPWDLSDKNKSKVVDVVKDTFRDKWLQYYKSEQNLANATAEQLKKNVDGINVGGTNWASNGNFEIDITKSLWKTNYIGATSEIIDISTETPPFQFAYHVKQATNGNAGIFTPVIWKDASAQSLLGKQVTVSFWLKYQNIVNSGRFGELVIEGETSEGAKVYRYIRVNKDNKPTETTYVTGTNTTWTKYNATATITLPTNATKITSISFKHGIEGSTGEFWTTGIKVEIGNKVTDWSQCPLDIQARLTDVEFKVTPDGIFTTLKSSSAFNATLASKENMRDFNFENGMSEWKQNHAGTLNLTNTKVVSGISAYGANVLEIQGRKPVFYGKPIPIDPTHVYKVTFRVRQTVDPSTAGTSKVYAGVASFNASKQPLTTSVDTFGSHRYCAVFAKEITVADGWQEFTGTISGEGDEGRDQFIAGTRYAVPMFLVNYSDGNGTVQVDVCSMEDISMIDAVANQVDSVLQQITPEGISTVITSSTFYEDLQSALDGKANSEDLGDYATSDYVDGAINGIDVDGKVEDKINAMNDDETSILRRTYATQLDLEQTSRNLTTKFSASGGMNLLKNSIGFSDFITKAQADAGVQNWFKQGATGRAYTIQTTALDTLGFGSGFNFDAGALGTDNISINQYVNVVPNQIYTLSWYMNKVNQTNATDDSGKFWIYLLESDRTTRVKVSWDTIDENGNIKTITGQNGFTYANNYTTNGFEAMHITFAPTTNNVQLKLYGNGFFAGTITGLMFTIGDVPLQWSLATGENYNTNVRLDINGIRVSQLDANKIEIGYTQITPSEFAGYWKGVNGNFERIFYLNGEETVTKKLRANDEIIMGTLKAKLVSSGGNNGWAFVPIVKK